MNPIIDKNSKFYITIDATSHIKTLCIDGDHSGFQGEMKDGIFMCPLSPENAASLKNRFSWLNPQPLGLATSFGFGDRVGNATPGHISAVEGTGIAPIFAQQSVRENNRTGRSPQDVLNDAMWAVFQKNWRDPWGADADHIKKISEFEPFIEAGYSFYTIDPKEYVDNGAHTDSLEVLRNKATQLPWEVLQVTLDEMFQIYGELPIVLNGITLEFQEETLLRALGKYGRAIAHIKTLSDYLIKNLSAFDLEASVDETDTPTSVLEHYFIASELRRLAVPFISLAPRFIGDFQKGVDYIGVVDEFERELESHAAVMHAIGGYKLSIHTGSDKFSIYPCIAKHARNLVHVKTAGTSYLECLRVIAAKDTDFFREILELARSKYNIDRATYHLFGEVEKVPPSAELNDQQLLELFDQFDARQVLHVTFGSVLDSYRPRIMEVLGTHHDLYSAYLESHFKNHLAPFS